MSDKIYGLIYVLRNDPEKAPYIYEMKTQEIKIGRSLRCDIRITLTRVSDEHCVLSMDSEERVSIRVLDERNLIYVNGWPVHNSFLNHGDVITIVGKSFRFEYAPDSLYYSGGTLQTALAYDKSSKVMSPVTKAGVPKKSNTSFEKRTSKRILRTNSEAGILKRNISMSESEKRSRVSFGPYLSPEQFDKDMAPATPLKKGGVPTPLKKETASLRQYKFQTGNDEASSSLNEGVLKSQFIRKKKSPIPKSRFSLNLKRKTAALCTPLRKASTALSHSQKSKSVSPVVEEIQVKSRVTRKTSLNFQTAGSSKISEPGKKLSKNLNMTGPEEMPDFGKKTATLEPRNQFSQVKTPTARVSSLISPRLSTSRKKKVTSTVEALCLTPPFLEDKKSQAVKGRKRSKSFPLSKVAPRYKRVSSSNVSKAAERKEKIADVGKGGITGGSGKQLNTSVTPVVSSNSVDTGSRRCSTRIVEVASVSKTPSPRSVGLKSRKVTKVSTPLRKAVIRSPYVGKTASLSPKETRKKAFVTRKMSLAPKVQLSPKCHELKSKKMNRGKRSVTKAVNKVMNVSNGKMADGLIQDQATDPEVLIVHSPTSANTQQLSDSKNKNALHKVSVAVSTPLQKQPVRSCKKLSFSAVLDRGSDTATRKSLKIKVDLKQPSGQENVKVNVTTDSDLIHSTDSVSPVVFSVPLSPDRFYSSKTKKPLRKIPFSPSAVVRRKVVTKGSTSFQKLSPGSSVKTKASSSTLSRTGNKENKSNVAKKKSVKNKKGKSPSVKSAILKQKNNTEASPLRKVSLRSGKTIVLKQGHSAAIAKRSVVNEKNKVSKTIADEAPQSLAGTVTKALKSSKNKSSVGAITTQRTKKKGLRSKVSSAIKNLDGTPRYRTRNKKSSIVRGNSRNLSNDRKKRSITHDKSNLSVKKGRQPLKRRKQNAHDETLKSLAFNENISPHGNEMENAVDDSSNNANRKKGKKNFSMNFTITLENKVLKRKHSGERIEFSAKSAKTAKLSTPNYNENVSRITRKNLKAPGSSIKADEKKNAQPQEDKTSVRPVKKLSTNRNTRKQKSYGHRTTDKTNIASVETTESLRERTPSKTKGSKRVLRSQNISLELAQADKKVNYHSKKRITSKKDGVLSEAVEKKRMKSKSGASSKQGKKKSVTKSPAARANKDCSKTGESPVQKRTTRATAKRFKQ